MRLGRYQLHEIIGSGTSGVVWRGSYAPTGMPVALKVMDVASAAADREVRAACAIHHQHVVPLLDVGRVTDTIEHPKAPALGFFWLAYDFVSGPDLRERAHELDWPALRSVLLALCGGLAAAHAHEVVHLDIKPANVLIGPGGWSDARITDFGVSVSYRNHADRVVVGTPRYMAPEQFRGRPAGFGPWTDVYSLGCLAYGLASGTPLVRARGMPDFAEAHLEGRFQPFTARFDVPTGFVDWLRAVLVDRVRSAAEAGRLLTSLGHSVPWEAGRTEPISAQRSSQVTVEVGGSSHTVSRVCTVPEQLPSLPQHWPDERPPPSPQQASAFSLQLARLRLPRLVGRSEQQSALWEAYRQVYDFALPALVWLEGPIGVGRRWLVGWLERCILELGAGLTVHLTAEADCAAGVRSLLRLQTGGAEVVAERAAAMGFEDEAVLRAAQLVSTAQQDWKLLLRWLSHLGKRGPHLITVDAHHPELGTLLGSRDHRALWVVVADHAPPALDGLVRVVVPPLSPRHAGLLVRNIAPLDPTSENDLIRSSGRRPRMMWERIVRAIERGSLERTPRGFVVRDWGEKPAEANEPEPPSGLAPLVVTPLPVPLPAAREVVSEKLLRDAVARGHLWEHDGCVSFCSEDHRRGWHRSLAAAERSLFERKVVAALEAASCPPSQQWWVLEEASRLAELSSPGEAARLAAKALQRANGRAWHRQSEVLAARARDGSPVRQGRWQLARVLTDRIEGRVDAARIRLEAMDAAGELRHGVLLERARTLSVLGDTAGGLRILRDNLPGEDQPILRGRWLKQIGAFARPRAGRDATVALEEAIVLLTAAGRMEGAGFCALWLAECVSSRPAEEWLARAEELFSLCGSEQGRVALLDLRAHQAMDERRWEEALVMHRRCVRMRREAGRSAAVFAELNVAMCLTGLGRGREALDVATRAFLEANAQGHSYAELAAVVGMSAASALCDEPSAVEAQIVKVELRLGGAQSDASFSEVLGMGAVACEERGYEALARRFRALEATASPGAEAG